MTRVKICGLTRPEDAALAARLGAWALGVIFAPESPRQVGLKQAAEVLAAGLAAPAGGPAEEPENEIECVGVFVNAEVGDIEEAVRVCGLTAVQLHGEETPEYCLDVRRLTGVKVIKAVRVSDAQSVAGVVRFDSDLVLLDTYHPELRGGTGKIFDWELAAALPESLRSGRLILSGGLTADNVGAAVREVGPYAVDVSSGVESRPGIKDEEKLKRLFEALSELNQKS